MNTKSYKQQIAEQEEFDALVAIKMESKNITKEDAIFWARNFMDKTKGLYHKFNVTRTDGSSILGGKHENCEYFVLDLTHDKYAKDAILAYANACTAEYPLLADDLRKKMSTSDSCH